MARKKYTMRMVLKELGIGLIDVDMYRDAWDGLVQFVANVGIAVLRLLLLATSPVSVPLIWLLLKWGDKRWEAKRQAARKAAEHRRDCLTTAADEDQLSTREGV